MQIEFLPPRYAVRREVRQRTVWRTAVFALFGGVIVVSSFLQYYQRAAIRHEIERLRPLRESAKAKGLRLKLLREELSEEQRVAMLYSYLRFPWPRTQILSEIVRPLPESVTLTSVRVRREKLSGDGVRKRKKPGAEESSPKASRDLATIKHSSELKQTTVLLEGVTVDVAQLYRFVDRLQRSPLFVRAEVDSLQSVGKSALSDSSKFHIRLVVRPGHGQPTGPSRSSTDVAGNPQFDRSES